MLARKLSRGKSRQGAGSPASSGNAGGIDTAAIADQLQQLLDGQASLQKQLRSALSNGAAQSSRIDSTASLPHVSSTASKVAATSAESLPAKMNLPGGVMISVNVRSQQASAEALATALRDRGIETWVCTQLGAGIDFRDAIVQAVKQCRVFLPLINDAWAASGECRDEFSLAKRRNLTSHESGRTIAGVEPRLPGIVPVAFPDLDWEQYPHVEMLAATTNFLVSEQPMIKSGDTGFIAAVLQALVQYHVEPHAKEKTDPQEGSVSTTQSPTTPGSGSQPVASVEDAVRTFRPGHKLPQRFLGTTSYTIDEHPFLVVVSDELDMHLTITERDRRDTTRFLVNSQLHYRNLKVEVRMGGVTLTDDEVRLKAPHVFDEWLDCFREREYGSETMQGSYSSSTGVLELHSVAVTGTAAPTWQHLTACDDGRVLVGVGGNMRRGKVLLDELDAFRFVAF